MCCVASAKLPFPEPTLNRSGVCVNGRPTMQDLRNLAEEIQAGDAEVEEKKKQIKRIEKEMVRFACASAPQLWVLPR